MHSLEEQVNWFVDALDSQEWEWDESSFASNVDAWMSEFDWGVIEQCDKELRDNCHIAFGYIWGVADSLNMSINELLAEEGLPKPKPVFAEGDDCPRGAGCGGTLMECAVCDEDGDQIEDETQLECDTCDWYMA